MVAIKRLSTVDTDFTAKLNELLAFEAAADEGIERTVIGILADVKSRGDAAVLEYTNKFDRLTAASMADLELSQAEMQAALDSLPADRRAALEAAAHRVRVYHEKQRLESWSFTEADGTMLGQMVTPLDRVGLYVPGGKAAYPSSVLMNAIPAKVAGVKELIMVVPTPGGEHNQLVLAAACLAGVDRVFTLGGAQAVGALAYGTQTVPQVDKIVGPGNAYVATAKRRVFGIVGIDMVAGPSEILVVADGSGNPDWVAMDLFSQAEHDELAQSILICPDAAYLERVQASIEKLLPTMPRAETIRTSLTNRGAFILVRDMDEAIAIANRVAPEHLELALADPDPWVAKIHHAGAIFIGHYTSESLGDYCAGPNHVLPTSGSARFSSPLGVYDFQKRTSLDQGFAGRCANAGPNCLDAGARRRFAGACQVGRVPAGKLTCKHVDRDNCRSRKAPGRKYSKPEGAFFGFLLGRDVRFRRRVAVCPAYAGRRQALDDCRGFQYSVGIVPVPAGAECGQSRGAGRQALPWPVRSDCCTGRAVAWAAADRLVAGAGLRRMGRCACRASHVARHCCRRLRLAVRHGLAHGQRAQGQTVFSAIYRVDRSRHRLAALADAARHAGRFAGGGLAGLLATGAEAGAG
jgi:histidinol dehydrogenase